MSTPTKPVEETISAVEANRNFFKLLGGVRKGRRYVVTSHGRPIARLGPCDLTDADAAAREAAKEALFKRLDSQPAMNLGITWTRDELYEH